ncbi:MAG: sodium/solute symporter [Opitutaceae bacterium]|nr:sodium/solute symporter [Opitutaceae bacterium]
MTTPIGSLHWIDIIIIAAYLCVVAGIGIFFSRRQKSLSSFIRGRGKIGWVALGMSLMAALNSGLDYVQAPAMGFAIGLVFVMAFLSWIPLYPWVSRVTLPFYKRLDVYSAYEYLEQRFGAGVRTLAAGIFILWRVGWMGAAIYVPCLAVKAATGGGLSITTMVVVLGVVVTIYTMLGGIEAVIWNDVAQFCIMFGGLAVTLYTVVAMIPGGMGEVLQVASQTGRLDLIGMHAHPGGGPWKQFTTFMTTEVTIVGMVLMVLLGRAAAFTSDQIAIQRFQSAESLDQARRSYIVNAVTDTVWMVVLGFVGLALFAYHRHFPFPEGMQNDRILPYFMQHHFPAGVTGLVIAAIFAASLSSVDSALNSSASIIVVDFYNRLWLGHRRPPANLSPLEERRQVQVSRAATACLGVLMIVIGINIERMGEIYQSTNKLIGAFFGPLFGIFVLGMFSRRAHSVGVALGALAGLMCSSFASFFSEVAWLQVVSGRLFGDGFVHFFKHLSWQWPPPIGVTATLVAGYALSRLLPSGRAGSQALTYAEVMKRPLAEATCQVVPPQ